jgi:enterochelin esterase-like enzyme
MLTIVAVASFVSGAAVVVASQRSAQALPLVTHSAAQAVTLSCPSPSLGGHLPTVVYLPPGYRGGSKHYPVVYFLHGLPANPTSYQANGFVAGQLVASRRSAIVVTPQGARSNNSDREYLDWDPAEDWPAAISQDLPRCIDNRYRTIRKRTGRVLAGLSAGGYGAFNIALRALYMFGAVESWSGYFEATDPTGDRILDLGSTKANGAARVPNGTGLASALKRWPTLLAFYVGSQDSRFLGMNQEYAASLTANHVPHVFRVYPGGHTVTLWSSQVGRWLGMALDALPKEKA